MNTSYKTKIYAWYIGSFLFPPGAWLFICWFSGLFSLPEILAIAASPLLGIYVIAYIGSLTLLLKKRLKQIENYNQTEQSREIAQKSISGLPYILVFSQIVYSIIGPNTGLLGKSFISSQEYFLAWLVGVRLYIVSILSSTGIISMIILFVYMVLFCNPDIEALAVLKKLLVIGALGAGAILSGIIVFARQISRQLIRMKLLAQTIAGGDVRSREPVEERDEIGAVMASLNQVCQRIGVMIKDIITHTQTLVGSSTNLSSISEHMAVESEQTSEKSNTVAAATEEMTTNMNSVSAAMEESSSNVNTVASAAEQMNATINEIAQNAETARGISDTAVLRVNESSRKRVCRGGK